MDNVKRVKVIMLPTNIAKSKYNQLWLDKNGTLYNATAVKSVKSHEDTKFQELYIISDDKIKKDDWFIEEGCELPINASYDKGLSENCKKIIATTDRSIVLNTPEAKLLPQPSEQFITKYIEEYNKSNIITDVLVEYTCNTCNSTKSIHNGMFEVDCDKCNYKNGNEYPDLKINLKDNTITIKKLKDNFTIDEIKNALTNTKLLTNNEFNDIWKLMKMNLG